MSWEIATARTCSITTGFPSIHQDACADAEFWGRLNSEQPSAWLVWHTSRYERAKHIIYTMQKIA